MSRLIKKSITKLFKYLGYSFHLKRKDYMLDNYIVELDNSEIELIKYVYDKRLTMVTIPRLINTVKSCCYVVNNKIPGDFIECGVWRGGNGILAKKIFEYMGSNKNVWMFDTFAGMTKPINIDVAGKTKTSAEEKFLQGQKEN